MTDLPQFVLVASLCIGVALPLLIWSLLARPEEVRQHSLDNLHRGLSTTGKRERGDDSGSSLADVVRQVVPSPWLARLDRVHAQAGRPAAWPMDRVLVAKLVLFCVGVFLAILQWSAGASVSSAALGVLTAGFLYFIPDLLLLNRAMKRRANIARKLPDALDQMSIAVEAGLGFEGAISHLAHNSEGPLSEELVRTLQDMQIGVPRRMAYKDLGDRNGVPDLRRFVRAIMQAEEHGISVAQVLQTQAAEMRDKRRQRAEETAMKIPVKVVFPLMFCILPALFVIVLGPAVINILDAFSGGIVPGD
jgi:tight adherence protein C